MIRMKYHAPGTPPATLIAKPKRDSRSPVLTLIQYDGDSIFEEEFDTFEGLMRRFDPSKVNWINVDDLSDVELLRKLADAVQYPPAGPGGCPEHHAASKGGAIR